MKRFTLIFLGLILSTTFVMAGGLVHNTNQSAAWSRMLSRGATLDIDAVYYNPAGLVKLKDGFHISISSQSIFQKQNITAFYPDPANPSSNLLNNGQYEGKISAPVFPSVYMAYKVGKFAFSAGFIAIGGGGGATFDNGVPMMEIPVASLAYAFRDYGVTGYSVNMQFEGSSVYWGVQAGISYAITKNISIFAGARYVMAKNKYKGYIRDITLKTPNGDTRADVYMNGIADQALQGSVMAQEGAALAYGAGTSMDPIIQGGGGALTWDQAVALGVLTTEQSLALQGGLLNFGFTPEQVAAMNMAGAQTAYFGTSDYLNGYAVELQQQAAQLQGGAALMGDQTADVTQTGAGITPIIGANLTFMENNLSIGLKYEFQTSLELENEVAQNPDGTYQGFVIGMDDSGNPVYMFPNGAKTNADLPAMLSVGVDYRVLEPLKLSVTYHSYFDKNTTWAEADKSIDNNFWEFGAGIEFNINKNFLISAGYLRAKTGVNQMYQSDLGFSLSTRTLAFGGAYKFNDTFRLNLGGYFVTYEDQSYNYSYEIMGSGVALPYSQRFDKSTFAVAIGLDISIGPK